MPRYKRRQSPPKRKFGGKPTAISLNAEFKKEGKTDQAKPVPKFCFVILDRKKYTAEDLRQACRQEISAKRSWPTFGHVPLDIENGKILVRITRKTEGFETSVMFFSKENAWERIPLRKIGEVDGSGTGQHSAGGTS